MKFSWVIKIIVKNIILSKVIVFRFATADLESKQLNILKKISEYPPLMTGRLIKLISEKSQSIV